MLEAVVADGGTSDVSTLARQLDMPIATAHRQVATLVAEGYLTPVGHGRHVAGFALMQLARTLDEKQILAHVAAPMLRRLSTQVRSIVQLGTLENEMVTYRVKVEMGTDRLFTQVGAQLEAYCSGMGKVLLAHLPEPERKAYLAAGPFVALTERTIVDPPEIARELEAVRAQGFAIDAGEIEAGLACLAVPVARPDGHVLAAVSISELNSSGRPDTARLLPLLRDVAHAIESAAFGDGSTFQSRRTTENRHRNMA